MTIKAGHTYKRLMEVIKMKNNKPTVIKVNDTCYRMDVALTEKERKAQKYSEQVQQHRLREMGRID